MLGEIRLEREGCGRIYKINLGLVFQGNDLIRCIFYSIYLFLKIDFRERERKRGREREGDREKH